MFDCSADPVVLLHVVKSNTQMHLYTPSVYDCATTHTGIIIAVDNLPLYISLAKGEESVSR